MDILNQLERLGFNRRQATVYLALLQLGPSGAIAIAKYTRLQHPTVYDALGTLKARGLVTESTSKRHKVFCAESPEILANEERMRSSILADALPGLFELYHSSPSRPRVHFYNWQEGIRVIYDALLKVKSKEYFYFGSMTEFFRQHSMEAEFDFVHERIKHGIRSYAIREAATETPHEWMKPGENNLREVRYFSKSICPNLAAVYIYDQSIAIASSAKENYCAIIESPAFHDFMKNIWDAVWQISQEEPSNQSV